jgi:5-methyltetrahydropteroyltriglutamate--homocysteine methyltransferase
MSSAVDTPLPTTMVGSYPRPLWFRHQMDGRDVREAFKNEEHLQAYEDAVGAVIRDQEEVGLDIVTDGQMYWDDYAITIGSFLWYWYERLPGFDPVKRQNPLATHGLTDDVDYELFQSLGGTSTTAKIERGPGRLAELYTVARRKATHPVKVSVGAGPINLTYHVYFDEPDSFYTDDRELAEDLVPIFNAEMKEVVAAGATFLQYEDLGAWHPIIKDDDASAAWVVDVVNRTLEGVDARIAWHFCLGNASGNAQTSVFGGQLERILPPLYETTVDQFVLDFALRDMHDVAILSTLPADKEVAAGVIDVRTLQIESAELVAERMRKVLDVVPAQQVSFTTDCGMRVLPRLVAKEKLRSLVRGAEIVRGEL